MEVTVVWVWFGLNVAKPSPPDILAQTNVQIQQKQRACYADSVSRQCLPTPTQPNLSSTKIPKMLHPPRHCSCTAIGVFDPQHQYPSFFQGCCPLPFSVQYAGKRCSNLTPFQEWTHKEPGLAHPSSNPPLKPSG